MGLDPFIRPLNLVSDNGIWDMCSVCQAWGMKGLSPTRDQGLWGPRGHCHNPQPGDRQAPWAAFVGGPRFLADQLPTATMRKAVSGQKSGSPCCLSCVSSSAAERCPPSLDSGSRVTKPPSKLGRACPVLARGTTLF